MSNQNRHLLIYVFKKFCSMEQGLSDSQAASLLTDIAVSNGWCKPRAPLKGGALLAMSKRNGSKPNAWMIKAAYHHLTKNNFIPRTELEKQGLKSGEEFQGTINS
jgi:hypothetical protein